MKEVILAHIEKKELDVLKELLRNSEEMAIIQAFYELPDDELVIAFRLLSKAAALSIFEELDTDLQKKLLKSFTEDRVKLFINEIAPDDRVKLLDELPATVAKQLLESLTPQERETTNLLMGYEAGTAGRIMTPEFITLNRDMTIEQALAKIGVQAEHKETIYTLFVTDSSKKLEGVLTLKGLLIAQGTKAASIGKTDGSSRIGDIMSKNAISVSTDTDQEEVARILHELDLLAVPVVDREGRIVGIVTIDDAVDIVHEETTEDIEIMAALTPSDKPYLETHPLRLAKNRIIWLMVMFFAAMLTGGILDKFEYAIAAIPLLVIFIPMLCDTGGNSGSQSATLIIRGLAIGEVTPKDFFKIIWKEIRVGLLVGTGLAVLNYLRMMIFYGNHDIYGDNIIMISVTVCLTLLFTVVTANIVGGVLPIIAKKCKIDPAVMAAPLITTIVDALSLIVYFSIAMWLLGDLMV
ncbi:MAG: magnesium transporter [Oscillospiraceae bacterium]|nr:magnesium transporter [Oscillospiraceae bacterium]